MMFLSLFLSAPVIVTSFTHLPSTICSPAQQSQKMSTLYAAKKRGGAMSRRKKQTDGDDKGSNQSSEESTPSKSDSIYSMPPLYDLAFGYRNYEEEVDFLLDVHEKYSDDTSAEKSLRILELAAGPARHSLAALSENPPSEVDSVVALDRSQAMVDYGLENADLELGAPGGRRDDFNYVNGDMRKAGDDYKTPHFNTAWLLLGSMQHLLTNEDVIACLTSVHSIIKPGGTVIIELPHPRETFKMGECTRNGWTVPLVEDDMDEDGEEKEYGALDIIWGEEGDEFDPVAQVRHFTVGLELTVNNVDDIPKDEDTSDLFLQMSKEGKTSVREIVPMRLFTLQEIDALARCAGFQMVAKYGQLADVSIESEEEAFRMVCVLKKCQE